MVCVVVIEDEKHLCPCPSLVLQPLILPGMWPGIGVLASSQRILVMGQAWGSLGWPQPPGVGGAVVDLWSTQGLAFLVVLGD